jgi:hypothetical protein
MRIVSIVSSREEGCKDTFRLGEHRKDRPMIFEVGFIFHRYSQNTQNPRAIPVRDFPMSHFFEEDLPIRRYRRGTF